MKVEVRPLPTKKWHGKEGKESFSRPMSLEVLYDVETGAYATGLTDEEEKKYSKITGLDLSKKFDPNTPHPYWSTKPAIIKLENRTMVFDTSNPHDFIKVKNLKASKMVANSMKEWEEGKFPFATHVIFDEEEEVTIKASKIEKKQKAVVLAQELSSEEKAQLVQIISNKVVRGRSPKFIEVEVDALIETKTDEFLRYAQMNKEEIYIRSVVLEALIKNTLTKEGTSIYYLGDLIGVDYESAVAWFKDPNNQKMKVAILEKLG